MPTMFQITPLLLVEMCLVVMAAGAAALIVMLKGTAWCRRQRQHASNIDETVLLTSDLVPDVAVIAVPPDSSADSMRFVRKLLKLYLGRLEIILVLDGESSQDLENWKREFHLVPAIRTVTPTLETKPVKAVYTSSEPISLTVVDKQSGGQADSFNAGINAAAAPVIATVDWNAQFSDDVLLHLIGPMIDDLQGTLAVGAVAPALPANNPAGRIYRLESLRTWLCRCAGLSAWNAFLPAPGAFLLFQRAAVIQARGFCSSQTGCALEMMLHLHGVAMSSKRRYRIRFIAGAVSRPTAPLSFKEARERSSREQREVAGALRRRKSMAFGFGKLGGLAIPGLFCTRLLLPVLEILSVVLAVVALACGWMAPLDLALLLAGTVAFGILASMTAVILEPAASGTEVAPGELAAMFVATVRENLGYRQGRNLRLIRDFVRGFRAA